MSRDKQYQKLLNSKRWKELRAQYLRDHPLCERCLREGEEAGIKGGYVRAAIDCHHRIPVESAQTSAEMERLCYSEDNLEALCVECHIKTHKEMRKGTKENRQERAQERLARWNDRIRRIGQPSPTRFLSEGADSPKSPSCPLC